MKAMDKLIAKIDKKLERFDPIWQAEHGTGGSAENDGVAAAFASLNPNLKL